LSYTLYHAFLPFLGLIFHKHYLFNQCRRRRAKPKIFSQLAAKQLYMILQKTCAGGAPEISILFCSKNKFIPMEIFEKILIHTINQ